jgi:hypothetical protein
MPFSSREELDAWLAEFEQLGYPGAVSARVIEQDGSDGANTGLVAARLTGGLSVYLQPDPLDGARWVLTIESREDAVELRPADVAQLSGEFATVAALCAFLEAKSATANG